MLSFIRKYSSISLLLLSFPLCSIAQEGVVIDQIVGVVGNQIVKLSDVEAQVANMKMQGGEITPNTRCEVFEMMIVNKLYENQANIDSVFVSETDVEAELDRRLRYYIAQIGSREKLEEFYKKSILEIKEEFREMIKSQLTAQRMEAQITKDVKVTPSEVRKYFQSLPSDSVPLIATQYELSSIMKSPKVGKAEREVVKQRLNDYRNRILKGERFATLAAIYSEDPGSAKKGGELGMFTRGDMYSEFESVAFSLKEGEISPVFETPAGFHIVQLVERQGENVNARHILLRPKPSDVELMHARTELDSVAQLIRDSVYTFEMAAAMFSDDPSGKTGGVYTSPYTGNSLMSAEEMDPQIFFVIDRLEVGQISAAVPVENDDKQQAYRIFYLKKRTTPHQATLTQDYDRISDLALEAAKKKQMEDWLNQKVSTTYVRIYDDFKNCPFRYSWFK